MPTLEIVMPELHPAQREVQRHPARFKVLACGRRWGKTLLGSAECTATAIERGHAWWVAPSYKMANVGWNGLKALARQIPGTEIREVERMVRYPGGGWAQVRSADDPQSLRGEGLDLVVIDECAFCREAAWYEALRPALSDRQGKAIFISTPKGRNWFWRLHQHGLEVTESPNEWMSWSFATSTNPFIEPAEIEKARDLPERVFLQEYMAEFIDDAGGVFRRVTEAATAVEQRAPLEGHEYAIGVDWGKHNDFTVFTVLDVTAKHVAALDRFNQIDYALQRGRLRALADRFQPRTIIVERNSIGEPNIEDLQRDGLRVQPFTTTNASKTDAIDALALAFERGDIKILPDPALVGELQAFEMDRTPSGMLRYAAPEGMHDDCVMSLALAWQDVAKGGSVFIL